MSGSFHLVGMRVGGSAQLVGGTEGGVGLCISLVRGKESLSSW